MPGPTTLRLDRAGGADALERDHDSPHRAEQSDERRDARRRRQERHAASRACVISTVVARSSARSTASRLFSVGRPAAAAGFGGSRRLVSAQLRVELGVAGLEQPDERALRQRRADRLHLRELAALAEHAQERGGLALGAPERPDLVEDDAPGDRREEQQDEQNGLRQRDWRPR